MTNTMFRPHKSMRRTISLMLAPPREVPCAERHGHTAYTGHTECRSRAERHGHAAYRSRRAQCSAVQCRQVLQCFSSPTAATCALIGADARVAAVDEEAGCLIVVHPPQCAVPSTMHAALTLKAHKQRVSPNKPGSARQPAQPGHARQQQERSEEGNTPVLPPWLP